MKEIENHNTDKKNSREQIDDDNKGVNKTIDYSGNHYREKGNHKSNVLSTTPKKITSKRDTRLREFHARSQRKQGNGEKLLGLRKHNFGSQDLTPKKSLGRAMDIMNLSVQLDNRNLQMHSGSNIELGNEGNRTNMAFMKQNIQKSYENIHSDQKHRNFAPKPTTQPRNLSTKVFNDKLAYEGRESKADRFIGHNSNDFNLNRIKINPLTGAVSPINVGKAGIF